MPLACARGASNSTASSTSARERERPRLQIELAGLDLGEIENLLDQRQQRFARGLRRLGVGDLFGRERRVEQQIGHAEDAVERRADFVADHGEEARLGAVGGFRLVARHARSARSASTRSVTSRPTPCTSLPASARTATSRQAIQRAPSPLAIFWSCTRVPSASTRERALLENRQLAAPCRSGPRALCRRARRRRRWRR